MARLSRGAMLWDQAKRSAAFDIRALIEEQAPRVSEALGELAVTVKQERATALAVLSASVTQELSTALLQRAPRVHTHPVSEVNGLTALLATLNQKITALEARVLALETSP